MKICHSDGNPLSHKEMEVEREGERGGIERGGGERGRDGEKEGEIEWKGD